MRIEIVRSSRTPTMAQPPSGLGEATELAGDDGADGPGEEACEVSRGAGVELTVEDGAQAQARKDAHEHAIHSLMRRMIAPSRRPRTS